LQHNSDTKIKKVKSKKISEGALVRVLVEPHLHKDTLGIIIGEPTFYCSAVGNEKCYVYDVFLIDAYDMNFVNTTFNKSHKRVLTDNQFEVLSHP